MTNRKMRIAAVMVGIALTLGSCSLFKSSSAPNDGAIVSAIQSKLYQDPVLKTSDVRVVSQNGVVVLTGTVPTDQAKASVEQFAHNTDGVKQVIDELAVSSSQEAASNAPEAPSQAEHRAPRRRSRALADRGPAPEPPVAAPESQPAAAPVERVPPAPAQSQEAPPPPPQPVIVTIPAGTVISVRTVDPVDSATNHPGDQISATVDSPIADEQGELVIPRYSKARLKLVSDRNAGRIKGRSEVQLQLVSVVVDGKTYVVHSGIHTVEAKSSRGKQTAKRVGIGAAVGGLIGAIAGGGKGAAIGAGIGAGAGTGVQVATKGQAVKIPPETKMDFTLRSPLRVSLNP